MYLRWSSEGPLRMITGVQCLSLQGGNAISRHGRFSVRLTVCYVLLVVNLRSSTPHLKSMLSIASHLKPLAVSAAAALRQLRGRAKPTHILAHLTGPCARRDASTCLRPCRRRSFLVAISMISATSNTSAFVDLAKFNGSCTVQKGSNTYHDHAHHNWFLPLSTR